MSTLTWVVRGYAVMFAAFLAPTGRLADTLGRKRVFLGALALVADDPGRQAEPLRWAGRVSRAPESMTRSEQSE